MKVTSKDGNNMNEKRKRRVFNMTQSKQQEEREWRKRKQSQNPHGKVKSFKEIAEDAGKNRSKYNDLNSRPRHINDYANGVE
ncbi:DUF6254 family protein [Bacillus sp. N9]